MLVRIAFKLFESCHPHQQQKGGKSLPFFVGADDRTRTCTLLALEPKSNESTNSTTSALGLFYHDIDGLSNYNLSVCLKPGCTVHDPLPKGVGEISGFYVNLLDNRSPGR